MKKDVRVGVVLGVIILAITVVFLSIKATVKEPTLPISEQEDGDQAEKLNTDELPSEPSDVFKPVGKQVSKSTKPAEQNAASAAKIKMQLDEIDDNVLVDEWEQSKDNDVTVNSDHTQKGAKVDDTGRKTTGSGNTAQSNVKKHTVQKGDTLCKLAITYYNDGAKWKAIQDANAAILKKNTVLKVGQTLIIPDL